MRLSRCIKYKVDRPWLRQLSSAATTRHKTDFLLDQTKLKQCSIMVYFFDISRKEPIEDFYDIGKELGR